MGFRAVEKSSGVSRADCVCDDCGKVETVPADYERVHSQQWELREGPLHKKMEGRGWSIVKKRLFCPSCTAKRKVVTLAQKETPSTPTRQQKREIIDLLKDVYDEDNEHYIGGDTDDTVASVLGVPAGWVAEIRDDLFGPAGGNEDIEALRADLEAFLSESSGQIKRASEVCEHLNAQREKARGFLDRLTKIEQAIGARNRKKIGAA